MNMIILNEDCRSIFFFLSSSQSTLIFSGATSLLGDTRRARRRSFLFTKVFIQIYNIYNAFDSAPITYQTDAIAEYFKAGGAFATQLGFLAKILGIRLTLHKLI